MMNFCSKCGSDRLEMKVPEGDNRSRQVCGNCGKIHYVNPRVVTGCLPVWEDQVLLCRRAIEPRKGYWNVPGGFLENQETVPEGARRELWEEARARVEELMLHSLYSIPHINQVYVHFLGQLSELNYEPGEESLEVELFSEADIPWEEIAFTSSVFSLERYFEDRRQGRRLTHVGAMQPAPPDRPGF